MASPSSPTCRSVDDAPSLAPMATKKPRPSSSKRGTLKRADTFNEGSMPLTLFHHLQGNTLIRKEKSYDSLADTQDPPPPEHLTRRDALVPEEKKKLFDFDADSQDSGEMRNPCDNVIIVPHMQITPGDSHLYNRAITSGGSVLAGLQKLHKATVAAQAFYSDTDEAKKSRSPWILKRLYDWSHRAKTREIVRHVQHALGECDREFEDEELNQFLSKTWHDLFPGSYQLPAMEQKRLQAVWELFHSELKFLNNQLLVLRNVYKEPLKNCQVEGCLLTVEPDLLFGNLDELCQISVSFCREFLNSLSSARITKGPYDCTNLLVALFDKFSKGPSTISAYQAYCINYKATMEYLESMRQDERFIEYERVCLGDQRCHRLQLEDLLISPLHRITRLPLLLKEVHKYTDDFVEKYHIERIIETLHESLRSIDDSVQWLHNFERLQQLQTQVVWPSIMDLEPRPFIPEFLKLALSRQFCENLLAHPRRKLIHEGYLECIESGKSTDLYAFLFNDMLLLTKAKKTVGRPKTANSKKSPGLVPKMDHINRYIVQRQPVPLDSCVFCDVGPHDVSSNLVVSVYTLQAASKEEKVKRVVEDSIQLTFQRLQDQWIQKFQESIENYESIQLKDMLKCTPLLSNSMSSFRCGSTTGGDARNVSRRVSREVSVQTLEDEDGSLSSPHQRQSSTDAEFSRPSALLTPDASHSGASRC